MMVDSGVVGPSTVNRRYKYDLRVAYHCQGLSERFLCQIQNKAFYNTAYLTTSEDPGLFKDSVCFLCFLCQHNVVNIANMDSIDNELSKRLILCSTDESISSQFCNVEFIDSKTSDLIEDCGSSVLRKIHSVLNDHKLYDELGSPVINRRTPSDTRGDPLDTYASQTARPMSPVSYQGTITDHIYEPLLPEVTPCAELNTSTDQFVEADTLKPNKNGIQILASLCLPRGTRDLNEDVNYIINVKLPELISEHNLKGIAELLKLDISEIVTKVIDTLTEECFKLPMAARFYAHIEQVLGIIWKFLERWKQDVVMVKSVTLLSHLLVSKFYLLSLNTDRETNNLIRLLGKQTIPKISAWLKLKALDKKVKELIVGSKLLMQDFINMVQNHHSVIQLGDWKVSLRNESNQKILQAGVKKMTLVEKSACILGLISLICDAGVHITKLPALIEKTCSECLFKIDKEVAYSFCIFAVHCTAHWLNNLKETDNPETCMKSMQTFLVYRSLSKGRKETLAQKLWSSILHTNDTVRFGILSTLSSMKCDDLSEIMCFNLQTSCQSGRLFITKEMRYFGDEKNRQKPRWSECKGTFGEIESLIKILIPTKNCVSKSVDDKYSKQQNVCDGRFGNTMSILCDLHQKGGHNNVVKLLSYQLSKMPLFYAVQSDGATNFLKFLLEKRRSEQWCCLKDLYQYVRGALSALMFLHSNKMIHRDITSCRFNLCLQKKILKLSDFRLTKKLQHSDTVCFDDSDTLAVRWSAIETLKDDEFSKDSDVWMFALFMYEVFTHGCWPYSEHIGKETGDIMHMVIIRGYSQSQPRCIPEKVFKVMNSCWERRADKRPSLERLQEQLNPIFDSDEFEGTEKCSSYLPLQSKQKKMEGQPELGVPPLIKQLKDRTVVPYYNTKTRAVTAYILKHEDLIADYEPEIKKDIARGTITVEERLDKVAKQHNLPNYKNLIDINDLSPSKLSKIIDTGETYLTYTYNDRGGDTLIDHAFKSGECENQIKLLYRLAKRIQRFHEHGWIVRCLSAKDIWKTKRGKICLLRLGRACKLQNDTAGDGHLNDKPFQDRLHWLPLEVHRDGFYTKKSDIYMFAMVAYEVFTAMSFNQENPLRNPILCVPFATTPRNELQDLLHGGEVPEKPEHCPASLYKLKKDCWSRDAVNRPFISDVLKRLKDILKRKDFNTDEDYLSEVSSIDPDYSSFSDTDSDTDDEGDANLINRMTEPPPLPARTSQDSAATLYNDSNSNGSFPNNRPIPFHAASQLSTPKIADLSFETKNKIEENNNWVLRQRPRELVKGKDAFHNTSQSSSDLSNHICISGTLDRNCPRSVQSCFQGTLEDNEDYLTPLPSSNKDGNEDPNYTVIQSHKEMDGMKNSSFSESNRSVDPFVNSDTTPFHRPIRQTHRAEQSYIPKSLENNRVCISSLSTENQNNNISYSTGFQPRAETSFSETSGSGDSFPDCDPNPFDQFKHL